MYVSRYMLTPDMRAWVLGEATALGDEWLESETSGKKEHEIALLPTGSQVVPKTATLLDVFLKDSSDVC